MWGCDLDSHTNLRPLLCNPESIADSWVTLCNVYTLVGAAPYMNVVCVRKSVCVHACMHMVGWGSEACLLSSQFPGAICVTYHCAL